MRIVNSPNLWDNQLKAAYHSKYFVRAYIRMLVGLAIVVLLAVDIQVHQRPNIGSAQPLISSATVLLDSESASKLTQDLLPEEDNPSTFLLRKLATPSPPPPPDCQVDPCLALTFDDGPSPDSSPIILSALEKAGAHASFFIIGSKIGPNAAILQRMQADGDDIGNHSWAHPDFTRIPVDQIHQQINLTQTAIVATGVKPPFLLRPPYGKINQTIVSQIDLSVIMWNVDPKDWAQKDPNVIAQMVEAQAKPGGIIVMHDKPLTAAATEKIIASLKDKYRLVTVSQLLGLNPTSRGIYFGR